MKYNNVEEQTQEFDESLTQLQRAGSRLSVCVAGGGFVLIILTVLLALPIIRSITRPINHVADALGSGAQEIASTSGQTSAASQSLAEGASQQAASLEETSASLEEMSANRSRS